MTLKMVTPTSGSFEATRGGAVLMGFRAFYNR